MEAKKKDRRSLRASISKNEYMQLVGLHAAYKAQYAVCESLQKAATAITQELGRDGKLDDCGHTMDWLLDVRPLDEMLELIGVKVRK